MSWSSYVDSIVGNSGGVISQATIIGLDGSVWTPKDNDKTLNITASEAASLGAVMGKKDETIAVSLAASGITIGETRYMFLRDLYGDGKYMTGKKASVGNLVMGSSIKAVVIAFIPEAKADAARSANTGVENIVKYLEGVGY